MLIPTFYYLISYLRDGRLLQMASFLLSLASIILSQSRTLYLAVLSGFFLLYFCGFVYRDYSWRRWLMLNAISLAIVIIVAQVYWEQINVIFAYAYTGLSALFVNGVDLSGQGLGSANLRISQFIWVLDNMDVIPIVGSGIGKGEMALESLYALYLYRYGALFLILFLILIIRLVFDSYRLGGYYRLINKNFSAFFYSLFFFYALSPVALLSSASQDAPRLSLVFYGGAALVFLNKRKLKVSKQL
jgi:hypothetical protein